MRTSPLKYLATILSCGAILASGEVSAQIQVSQATEYTARPLPPLPAGSTSDHLLNATTSQAQIVDSGRLNSGTLFTIDSPPVPPGYDVSARIIRPATVGTATQPAPAQVERTELMKLTSSTFNVAVESPTNVTPPPAVSTQRVPDSPDDLFTQKAPVPGGYLVSFEKKEQAGDLEPVLDSPVPDSDTAETTMPDDNLTEPESVDELEFEDASESEDGDRETDDLDDEEKDDLQPEPRQFGVWPKKSIQEVRTDIRDIGGEVPTDQSDVLIASTQRYYRSTQKTEKVFAWAAPKIRYQPLFFEDAQLERYGQTRGLVKQPIVSGFKFFRDAALLPLNASIDCPGSCDGPLGFCRPGSPCSEQGCSSCQR